MIAALKQKMHDAAEALEFEQAARFRDEIQQLEQLDLALR